MHEILKIFNWRNKKSGEDKSNKAIYKKTSDMWPFVPIPFKSRKKDLCCPVDLTRCHCSSTWGTSNSSTRFSCSIFRKSDDYKESEIQVIWRIVALNFSRLKRKLKQKWKIKSRASSIQFQQIQPSERLNFASSRSSLFSPTIVELMHRR